ncbi:MAG: flagellar biosynthesis protein FlhB, partial [Pontibacterium sp.]
MAEDSGQEKSEEPTAKRLADAREKGEVPRSKELVAMAVLLAAAAAAMMFGPTAAKQMLVLMQDAYQFDRAVAFDTNQMILKLAAGFFDGYFSVFGFFIMVMVAALVAPIALGGWNFSAQAMAPKGSRLNPLSGIKRMFSMNALVELLKALAKFSVVAVVAIIALWTIKADVLSLGSFDVRQASANAIELVIWVFLIVSASLILIAAIDVPYQIHAYNKKLKMTFQEVKDEMKNTEGKPEVKGRIRQLQREISQRKMMKEVPTADVVITNPTHYSVALRYEQGGNSAPIVIALGADFIALRIRDVARENNVPIIAAPPLARALYYNAELDQEIPSGLFTAVAQVLAYVYQLKSYKEYRANKPEPLDTDKLTFPDE